MSFALTKLREDKSIEVNLVVKANMSEKFSNVLELSLVGKIIVSNFVQL